MCKFKNYVKNLQKISVLSSRNGKIEQLKFIYNKLQKQ